MKPFYLHRPLPSLLNLLANRTLLLHGPSLSCLCGLKKGDVVELTQDMGKGFEANQIQPLENYATVLIFTTGSGISPIRSLIESGFNVDKGFDVKLFYGARNLDRMAYQYGFVCCINRVRQKSNDCNHRAFDLKDVKKMKMNH
ncbi:hypothetical protein RchiOBHm_Chr2g0123901 [Rosa chinensis]|uniref:Oxidoreductase FAD/NAD(P)-binding domain-containing protein n=1 Tax=Rosa chinensis TaxID=74649 RepID=A0A2P6RT59_ROSCH|nr:fruit protein pKIWI502 [Rosa chinensis]PRQ49616.1 hypothetical protein RchiOBHm_Chr2g0123901 [Rosa chinensis]